MNVVDLFAGPGGWDVAARELGLDPLGIEFDESACETREAAGHRTLKADVSALDPLEFAPIDLLIASPPCQAWSLAGSRGGKLDLDRVFELTRAIAHGEEITALVDDSRWEDPRSRLVCEPLRWICATRPRYVALEQVPPVLDYWKLVAVLLRELGYGVWTGILEAERYGVPQTRERAILLAEIDAPDPQAPAPTHQRYVRGEPQRHEITLEGELLPWVSMSEALGWGMSAQPYMSITSGGGGTHTGGANSRAELRERRASAEWIDPVDVEMQSTNGQHTDRRGSEPSSTIDSRTDQREFRVGFGRRDDVGDSPDGLRERDFRSENEPAHSLTEKARGWTRSLIPSGGERDNSAERDDSEPASTIFTSHSPPAWRESGNGDVRLTEDDAAILQGFPRDYPWRGVMTKRFQQIGNAVPPPLAGAVFNALGVAEHADPEALAQTLGERSEALREPQPAPNEQLQLSWIGDYTGERPEWSLEPAPDWTRGEFA